ncbi:carboxypeptidase-like regulatory domain-containing protein [Marinifilum flexuosum]|uniref:carboxypeptidase-like regulatory domain-containing protein n=1 Tax=Marinifilum flexuosum TaxID=1117708 RepID=UPI002491DA0C|nr:carboxypeptidase-like regulatory domain-containing protein [Marinifilum flexuosum]
MKNLICIISYLLVIITSIHAQNKQQQISGKVVDSKTKAPLVNVEVFVSGTTVGTTTNDKGEFKLNSPVVPCHIGLLHVAYQPLVLTISDNSFLNIKLSKKTRNIHEVQVKAKNKRRANLRMFKKYFLYYAEKSQVKILNDSVLRFKKGEYDFHAFCNSPLIIENKHLAYQIKILIKDFHVCKKDKVGGEKISINKFTKNALFKLQAFYYYQDINRRDSVEQNLIKMNRRKHYYGSLRHFLSSLYSNELGKNGFSLQSIPNSGKDAFTLTSGNDQLKRFKFMAEKVKVTYHEDFAHRPVHPEQIQGSYATWPTTFISLGHEFEIRPNGTSTNLNFEIHGSMGQKSLANTLPDNYIPESNPDFNL